MKKGIEVYSSRLKKCMMITTAIALVVSATLLLAILIAGIGFYFSENENVVLKEVHGFDSFVDVMFLLSIISVMVMAVLLLYNYMLMGEPKEPAPNVSPLRGAAVEHEKEIIELLKTVAHPLPGKSKLNRAHTAQFLTAMKDLELIDPNLVGKQQMAWVQDTTGYHDGAPSAFTQALNAVKTNDPEVARLKNQISQIVGA